jgi:hypothetical protein
MAGSFFFEGPTFACVNSSAFFYYRLVWCAVGVNDWKPFGLPAWPGFHCNPSLCWKSAISICIGKSSSPTAVVGSLTKGFVSFAVSIYVGGENDLLPLIVFFLCSPDVFHISEQIRFQSGVQVFDPIRLFLFSIASSLSGQVRGSRDGLKYSSVSLPFSF